MTALSGHTTPETAYVVDDYPYGFRLRCKIRYWLEYKSGHGFRLVSQTTNPKVAGDHWNAPKRSTYTPLAVMTLDDSNGHIGWTGIGHYEELPDVEAFEQAHGHAFDDNQQRALAYIKHILARRAALRKSGTSIT
jgi:hypothetical protein